jgi:hypothetical protein
MQPTPAETCALAIIGTLGFTKSKKTGLTRISAPYVEVAILEQTGLGLVPRVRVALR